VSSDESASARLLFSEELGAGVVGENELATPRVRRAVRSRPVASAPRRLAQRLLMRTGRLGYEHDCVGAFDAARRSLLGNAAAGDPRLLVRVDEFPHARSYDLPDRYGPDRFERFHAILRDAGVPYLLAVTPRVAHDYLDPDATVGRDLSGDEIALLERVRREGVELALHGYDHRTRHASPRRHSELCGLPAAELDRLLDRALTPLSELGIVPRVFVPAFNRFDAGQYPVLARRFDVVCGGPETVGLLGYHRTPLWRGAAVYLPAYPPLYARAADVAAAVERLAARRAALWVPVALHWGWEADDGWEALERAAEMLARFANPWGEFLECTAREDS
jgi:predicted deacetylase